MEYVKIKSGNTFFIFDIFHNKNVKEIKGI